MKRLVFLTKINFESSNNQGIKRKVEEEVEALRALDIKADLCYLMGQSLFLASEEETILLRKFKGHFASIHRFIFFNLFLHKHLKGYNVLYIRHFLITPFFFIFLSRIRKVNHALRILMEIPTYPYIFAYKKASFSLKVSLWIDVISMSSIHFFIDRLVLFADKQEVLNTKVINIDNGIDLKNIKVKADSTHNTELNIICLANLQPWHGFDRAILGLSKFLDTNRDQKIKIHVVGDGPERPYLENLVQQHNLNDWVLFYGFLKGNALSKMFDNCHLAIASIGMHRIRVKDGETSPLKTREYTARGIPFIYGYYDRLIDDTFPYALRIQANEDPLDFSEVLGFYAALKSLYNVSFNMRSFAENNLSWNKLMLPIKQYLYETE